MLSKRTVAILACLLMVASFVFVYSISANQQKEDKDPTDAEKDANTSVQATARLTYYSGGVIGYAKGESFKASSLGSMYLYAIVSRKRSKSLSFSYSGAYSKDIKTDKGANATSNKAAALAKDYNNNQVASAVVRGKV